MAAAEVACEYDAMAAAEVACEYDAMAAAEVACDYDAMAAAEVACVRGQVWAPRAWSLIVRCGRGRDGEEEGGMEAGGREPVKEGERESARTGLSAKGVVTVVDEDHKEKLVKCASDNDMEER
jgi:hypothetical protein